MANVAINGMGRIGRATLRVVMDTPELTLVGVNDIADPENIAYLLIKHLALLFLHLRGAIQRPSLMRNPILLQNRYYFY